MKKDRDAIDFAGFADAGVSGRQKATPPRPISETRPEVPRPAPSLPVENKLNGSGGCAVIILVAIVILIIIAAADGGGTSSGTATTRTVPPQASRVPVDGSRSPPKAIALAPASQDSNVETPPARGSIGIIDRAELRWCINSELRLTKLHELVIDEPLYRPFNAALDNYRERCRLAKYRDSDMDAVRRERDAKKQEIDDSALTIYQNWSRQYMHPVVLSVQENLVKLGYDPGPVDGIVGPQTRTAIRKLESDLNTPPTGLITFQLRDALEGLVQSR